MAQTGLPGWDPALPARYGIEFVRWSHTTDPSAAERFWTEYLAGTALPRPLPGHLGAPAEASGA